MSGYFLEAASALALAAAALMLARWLRLIAAGADERRRARWLALGVFAGALIPVNGLSAARLLLTLSPSLSLSTIAFSVAAITVATSVRPRIPRAEFTLLAGVVLLVSLPLYASVLRLWPFDLYVAGYHFSWLDASVAGLGILAAWRGFTAVASVMLGALVTQFLQLLPSRNLWDTLTDGLAFFVALTVLAQAFAGWLASRRRRPL